VRYRAFISYSHTDAATASWLHRKLEGWRVPKRMRDSDAALPERLAPVFRDREELASAGELGPQIQAALADSDALIVLCSPEAARSRWVDAEVQAFRRGGRGDRVFALIVAGEPNAGDERECFPPSLREGEPLAADLRPGKDGKELALLKLISGLLRVPLDTLRQREARRRHQRMLAVTSIAVAVMLVTSILAVQAVIARQAAERRQKQAEALVGFMLGDLNDKLTQVARLDILEGVHDHAMEYFQSLPADDVTDAALEQRARALLRIGNVRQEQGHLDKALASYLAADKLAAALAQAAPADIGRQQLHGDLLAFVGMMHWYGGDLDQAQAGFDAAREVLVRAQAHAPTDAKLVFQLSTLENNAGHVLEARGRIDEAADCYRRMLGLARMLVETAPGLVEGPPQLGLAHNNLAKMALLRGDLAGAVAGYRADVAIEDKLAAADPRDNSQAERAVLSRAALGRTLALTGALEQGASELLQALESARRLHALEPDSAFFQEDVALYSTQLARLRRLQGDLAAARALANESVVAFDGLLAKDANDPARQRGRAEALVEQSEQAVANGDTQAAGALLRAALQVLEPQSAQQGQDRALLLATTLARLRLAALEPSAPARKLLLAAQSACKAQASGQRDPRLRALRVELLQRLGERAAAQELAGQLLRDGYRDASLAGVLRELEMEFPAAPARAVATQ